jgi:outer membrane protein assembly factor BamB
VRNTKVFLVAGCLLGSGLLTSAGDWPGFRGPTGDGVATDSGLPTTWSAKSNVVWKTKLPGPGTSSPIVVGKKVLVTSYSGYAVDRKDPGDIDKLVRHLVCLDRDTGKVLWTRDVPAVQPEHRCGDYLDLHGYASSTPASDGKNVFVFFGKSGVLAYDLGGKKLWTASVGTRTDGWGSASSPVLYKDLVIVNAGVESGALVALDKKKGTEVWRARGISESWTTPVLVKVPGSGTELVVSASKKVLGFDPDSGKELWRTDSFTWYVCPTVVAHDGVVYALQNDACVAVKAGGRGNVTKTHTLWKKNLGSVVPSPVYHKGHLYWATGTALCVKADDGSVVYRKRLTPDPGNVYASPLLGDGKIYYVSRTKGAYVVAPGPEFKQLAHNTLEPDKSVCNGSPAVSEGRLLLRSDRYLYCIGKER